MTNEFTLIKNAFNNISTVSEEDWQMLEALLHIKDYKKNDYYLREGETEQKIGFILKAGLKWYYINHKGEEVNFHFFFENCFMTEYYGFV